MSLIKFNSSSEQRKGAQLVLLSLNDIPPVQTALAQIEREVALATVSQALRENVLAWFGDQREYTQKLESDLRYERQTAEGYQYHLQRLQEDPLQNQLQAAKEASESTARKMQDTEAALARAEEIIDRERRMHAAELQRLEAEIAELNRLIAKQHLKLQELIGDEPE